MKKTLMVLSLTQCYGGGEKSVEVLIAEWAKEHTVVVFAEYPPHLRSLRQMSGTDLHIIGAHPGKSPWSLLRNVFRFAAIMRRFRPDLILANSNKAAMVVALWRKLLLGAAVPTGIYLRSFGWRYVDFILRALPQAIVLVPTRYVLEGPAYAATQLPRAPTAVIPNGVVYTPADTPATEGQCVVCLANITRWKGLHYLLQAFNVLLGAEPGARLQIIGNVTDEHYLQELQEQVRLLRMEHAVAFIPFLTDPSAAYERALFLVVSSVAEEDGPETFSRVIIEAWAKQRAVVSFAVGGPKYLINDEINGLLVPEKDTEQLGQAMLRLWRDPDLRRRLATAGFEEMLAHYQSGNVAQTALTTILESSLPAQALSAAPHP